jgi:hypothetical protein
MASSVFPIASASTGPNSWAFTCAAALTKYKPSQAFAAGVYTMTTSPNTSQATVTFYNATSIIYETTTTSGTVTFNLGTAATGIYLSTNTGTDVVVSIALTSNSLTGTSLSGTLDTITSTSTYNQTGQLYVVAYGGGGSGGCGYNNDGNGGGGGGGAGPQGGLVYTNSATSITIGAEGAGRGQNQQTGIAGGSTTFGNLFTSSGGGAGALRANSAGGATFTANHPSVQSGTNGDGGSGNGNYGTGNGGGSGVGTGGNGGNGNGSGNAATGYAAGGGGGGRQSPGGGSGSGSPGVVYVLRGF